MLRLLIQLKVNCEMRQNNNKKALNELWPGMAKLIDPKGSAIRKATLEPRGLPMRN